MRPTLAAALVALALVPEPGTAEAQKRAAPKPEQEEWVTTVSTYRLDEIAADPSTTDFAKVRSSWLEAWQWITPEDVPPEYRRRPLRNQSIVVVDVDTAGKPAGCRRLRASPELRLDALACELLMKRSTFPVRYSGPAQPLPYRFPASVLWRNMAAAEVGPPPPPVYAPPAPAPTGPVPPPPRGSIASYGAWPRLNWTNPLSWPNDVVLGPPPSIRKAWPGGTEGTVSLDLTLSPEKGATNCRIGVSSGVAALDQAACRVAATLPVRYERPCELCRERTIPLQIVWKKKGSLIRLPLRPDSPAYVGDRRRIAGTITAADFASLPDRSVAQRLVAAQLAIDKDGRPTRCFLWARTGNRAVDLRICGLVLKRMRYSRRTDVFGEPAGDLHFDHFDLTGVL